MVGSGKCTLNYRQSRSLNCGQILEGLGQVPYTLLNKTQRVAFATILFKYVILALKSLWKLLKLHFFFDSISCSILRTPIDTALQPQYLTLVLGVRSLSHTLSAPPLMIHINSC